MPAKTFCLRDKTETIWLQMFDKKDILFFQDQVHDLKFKRPFEIGWEHVGMHVLVCNS